MGSEHHWYYTERRLEKCLDEYYTSIDKAFIKACPKKKPASKDSNNLWWNFQLQRHRKQINKLYRKRKNSTECWEEYKKEYKKEEKSYRKACNKAKRADWKYIIETQSSTESINRLRKILEMNKKCTLGVLDNGDGTVTEPGEKTIEFLLKAHFPAITNP